MGYKEELILRDNLINDNKNIFVMAGAGAGKTHSLVNRIINQILAGAKTSEIVAISFTNKSAEELRERIIKSLDYNSLSEKDKNKYSEDEIKIMKVALDEIDSMHISTIHKFCSDIVRENSIYAKVSPNFSMLDDKADDLRKKNSFKNYLKTLSRNDWDSLLKVDKTFTTYEIYNELIKHIDNLKLEDIYLPNNENLDKYIETVNKSINNILNICIDNINYSLDIANENKKPSDCYDYIDILKKNNIFGNYYLNNLDIKDVIDVIYNNSFDENELFPFNKSKFRGNQKKIYIDELYSDIEKDLHELAKRAGKYKLYICLKYAYKAYQKYLKDIDNDFENISNDEIIVLARNLLRDNKDIRIKLQKKYKHIYIDEYQDTDHLQRDIALLLTMNNDSFIDDSLFLVGDPKQSIYRFRGAEPEVYYDTKNLFNKNNTETYDLNINFRSNNKIIEYVNESFSKIKLTNNSYDSMLVRDINNIDDKDYNDNNLIGFYKYNGIDPDNISNLIKYIKNNYKIRRQYMENDCMKTGYFDIKYSDFMIQMMNHSTMSDYVKSFNLNKIPSKVSGESNFYSDYHIRVFINLFEALNTNGKASNVMAYEAFKLLYPKKFINKNEKEKNEISSKLLNDLKNKIYNMNSYGIAIYLINHLNWIMKEEEKLEAFEINNIESKLYQIIENIFSLNFDNGSHLSTKLREYVMDKIEYESLIDDEADAVSIINVHKAKGLEAPIVIFVCNDFNEKKPGTIYLDDKLYIRITKASFYDELDDIYPKILDEVNLEKMRIEYVALTRPREAFIFAKENKDGKTSSNFIDENYKIDELREILIDSDIEENLESIYEPYETKNYSYNNDDSSLKIISPSGMENNISITRLNLYNEAKEKGLILNSSRPKGNILGTILHRVFELYILNRNSNLLDIIDIAIRENSDYDIDYESYKDFILVAIKELDKLYKDIDLYNNDLYPEFTFSYFNNGNIYNGSIDLLSINGDNAIIIDYKSDEALYILDDDIFEKTLKEKYKNQLDLYADVIQNIMPNIKHIEKKIIYFRRYQKEESKIDIKIMNI